MSLKIDLHTHSYGSPDGGLKLRDYKYFLDNKLLNYIAVTDHNSIKVAVQIQKELGQSIIVGEEIMTKQGEIIGLYLTKEVPTGLTAQAAIKNIKRQGGLVYLPHPFETLRSGISEKTLGEIIVDVDIIEVCNGRAYLQNRGTLANSWAEQAKLGRAASSDAHGRFGWGYTYSLIDSQPTKTNLQTQLRNAEYSRRRIGLGVIYPKLNRLKNKLRPDRV